MQLYKELATNDFRHARFADFSREH